MSEYNRHKWAMEWMHGGGRDPNGRSLDEEIKIGKEDWMERQRVAAGGRIGLQSGQLVQPGPGRQGYGGKTISERRTEKTLKTLDKHLPALEEYIEKNAFKYKDGDEFYDAAIKHFKNNPKHEGFVKSSFSRQFGKNELFDIPVPIQKRTKEAKELATYSYRGLFSLKASAPINLKRYVKDMMWINMLEKNKAYNKEGGLADNLIKYFSGEELAPEKLNDVRKWTGKHLKAKAETSNLVRNFFKSKAPNFDEVRKLWQTSEGNLAELRKLLKNPNLSEGYVKKVRNAVASIERHRVYAADMREEFPKLFKKKSLTSFPGKSKTLKIETMEGEHRVPKASNTSVNKLPKTYLLRTEEVPGTFNVIKMNEFDTPLIKLMEKYKNASSAERKDIQKKITDLHEGFNKNSGGYLDELTFKFDADKGTVTIRDTMPLSKKLGYDDYKRRAAKNMQHMQSYIKNTKPYKKFAFKPKELKKFNNHVIKSYQEAKIGGHCRAYGGRVGLAEAGAVGMSKCMEKAIADNKKAMNSTDQSVRAAAVFKNSQAVNNAKKIPQIAKLIRMGLQWGKSSVGWLLGGWNIPIEAIVEGGIYEYYRREGYTHDQAYAETFTPRLLTEGAEARSTDKVPWYGGAEQLLEDDLIDLKGTQPHTETLYNMAAKEQIDNLAALGEATIEYNKTKSHLAAAQSGRTQIDPETIERLQIRLKELEAEGIRLDRLTKEGTSGSEALRTAQEKLDTEQGLRAIEYGEYGRGDTEALAKKRERVRQREMEDKFPGYGKADIDKRLEDWGYYIDPNLRSYKGQTVQRPEGLKFLPGTSYDDMSDYIKDQDKRNYFAENFRLEKADGGLASLLKK